MTEILSKELKYIQSKVIGLCRHVSLDNVEPIIEQTKYTVTTISIGDLLGLSTTVISKTDESFVIIKFPDGKTLSEMLDNPIEFNNWYNDTVIVK